MTSAALLALLSGALAGAAIGDLAPRRRGRQAPRIPAALARLGRAIGTPVAPMDLGSRLEAAGTRITVADAMALKAGAAAVALLAALPVAAAAPGRLGPAVPLAGAAAGFLALDAWLLRRTAGRRAGIEAELPDVLDLLRVVLAAGLPPTRALAEVGRRHPGLLAAELRQVAGLIAAGAARSEALDRLRRRAPVPGVAALVAALDRAGRLGTPPHEALAALARDAREARARATATAAARAAPKIQLVVALLLVPSVLLLVAAALAPAVLSL